MREETKNITLCSMFAAINVVLTFLSSAFPNMSLSILAVCGAVSAIALSECGYKHAFLMYTAVSLIAAVFVPDKTCAVMYVLLFGHYPMLKILIERVGRPWLSWTIKIVLANALAFAVLYVTLTFLTDIGDVIIMGRKFFFLFYNLAVVLYDIFIGRLMLLYASKRRISRRFH